MWRINLGLGDTLKASGKGLEILNGVHGNARVTFTPPTISIFKRHYWQGLDIFKPETRPYYYHGPGTLSQYPSGQYRLDLDGTPLD